MRPIVFWILFIPFLASARVIHVGPLKKIKSLRTAVELAKTADTIILEKGIYKEGNIVVSKSLRIFGEVGSILDGEHKFEVLTLTGKKFYIKNLTIRNSGSSSMNDFAAIKVIDASDFILDGNSILNAYFAYHISNCDNFIIRNNNIIGKPGAEQSTGNGIHIWKSSNAKIYNNRIKGHRDGIYLEFVSNSIISNNVSVNNNRYGMHFMFSNDDQYISNLFSENGAGVAVMFSKHIAMRANTFKDSHGASAYGLLLKEISDGEIVSNTFQNNTMGIYMEGTNRLLIRKNTFLNNGYAMRMQANCDENLVELNNFISNTFDVATNGSLVSSKIQNNYWDKYEGYDLDRNGIGDIPYHPVSLYSMIIETNPAASIFLRSFMVLILDKTERSIPSITPESFKDISPVLKKIAL